MLNNNQGAVLSSETGLEIPEENSDEWNGFVKACSKTSTYKSYVTDNIAKGEIASSDIGNMYTASIFMSFISYLFASSENNENLIGKSVGFLSYGSGSKSKVFNGVVQDNYLNKVKGLDLFNTLNNRKAIDFKTYEQLQKKALKSPLNSAELKLKNIGKEANDLGYRYYTV